MYVHICMHAGMQGGVCAHAYTRYISSDPTSDITHTCGHARKTFFICKQHGGRTNTTSVAEVGVGSVVFKGRLCSGGRGSGCMQEGLAVLIRSTYLHIYFDADPHCLVLYLQIDIYKTSLRRSNMSTTVAIAGGSTGLGRAIVEALKKDGRYEVLILSRKVLSFFKQSLPSA